MPIYFTLSTPDRNITTLFDADGLDRARSFKRGLIRDGVYRPDQITISWTDVNGKAVIE